MEPLNAAWEITGNHYLALPCIATSDGALHEANVVHHGMASLLSWRGDRNPSPEAVPLLRLGLAMEGRELPLEGLRWERVDRWIPRFSARAGDLRVVVTFCTPGGFDPLAPGGAIIVHVEGATGPVRLWLEGSWSWSLRTVASTRPLRDGNRLWRPEAPAVVLEAGDPPAGAALAITLVEKDVFVLAGAGDDEPSTFPSHHELAAANGGRLRFRLGCERRPDARQRFTVAFVLGVAPERDGAVAAALRLAGLGADELVRRARLDLASLNRISDEGVARDIVARNLVFHHYWAAARAVDDDRLYPVLSRSPEHGECAVFGEREALAWSLPAYALTDPLVARELLVHELEVYSDRPGNFRRYLNGGILDAGFSLGRACEYALAIERYSDVARDAAFADEPLVQQILRDLDDMAWSHLHREVFLGSSEVLPGGERADYPFAAFDNVVLWKLCGVLERLWRAAPGEARPRLQKGEDEIRAAFWLKLTTDVQGLPVIAASSDLSGHAAVYDDPAGSLGLLPYFEFCEAEDPIWSNTMELLHSPDYPLYLGGHRFPGLAGRSQPRQARFAALCADLLTPRRREGALEALRALNLPAGVAVRAWDPDSGSVAAGPYAASEAGFLVWALLHESAAAPRRKKSGR